MGYYLVKYKDNWADEMNVEGHVVLTEKEYEAFQKNLDEVDDFLFVVGSNQDIEYDTKEDLEAVIDRNEISEEDYQVFEKHGLLRIGFAPELVEQLAW